MRKGDRVVVTGKLKIRDWENGERTGTTIEIDAEALGHDLMWGSSTFTRSVATNTGAVAAEFPASVESEPADPDTEDPAAGEALIEAEIEGRPAVLEGVVPVPF